MFNLQFKLKINFSFKYIDFNFQHSVQIPLANLLVSYSLQIFSVHSLYIYFIFNIQKKSISGVFVGLIHLFVVSIDTPS